MLDEWLVESGSFISSDVESPPNLIDELEGLGSWSTLGGPESLPGGVPSAPEFLLVSFGFSPMGWASGAMERE